MEGDNDGVYIEGLCSELKDNTFDFEHPKNRFDFGRPVTTMDKYCDSQWLRVEQYVGRVYGVDVLDELISCNTDIQEPQVPQEILDRHATKIDVDSIKMDLIQEARAIEIAALDCEIARDDANQREKHIRLQFLFAENKEHRRVMRTPPPMIMSSLEQIKFSQEWFHYRSRQEELANNRIKVFYLILGQCSERLIQRMRIDREWRLIQLQDEEHDLPGLFRLIEKTISREHRERNESVAR